MSRHIPGADRGTGDRNGHDADCGTPERDPQAHEDRATADRVRELEQRIASLERRLEDSTRDASLHAAEAELLSRELDAFTFSVAHDLRAPLVTIDGFAQVLKETSADVLGESELGHLDHIQSAALRMHRMIEALLELSRIARAPLNPSMVDLSTLVGSMAQSLRDREPQRVVQLSITPGLTANGDARLLRILMENLLSNAWKFTSKREQARIGFDTVQGVEGAPVFRVKDNGAGFDPRYAGRLFGPFQRCHLQTEFPGVGMGLAVAQRIVRRHGGRIWVESQPDQGATFYFTLPG